MNDGQKRGYQKRSDYWNKFQKKDVSIESFLTPTTTYEPELIGESFYQASASTTSSGSSNASRSNRIHKSSTKDRFKNIAEGLLPFNYTSDLVNASEAIELCQKAYFNIPTYRATIDLMAEFADAELYLEGGSANAKKFINAWWKRIQIHNLKGQFFREYYRSGNVFFFRFDGKFKSNQSKKVIEAYGATNARAGVPVKYLLLNPTTIGTNSTLSFDNNYCKILTSYEIARLKKPLTEQEKEFYEALPPEVKQSLQASSRVGNHIQFPLDKSRLHAVFFKKQDYEPFSIPLGFSVLDDINKKLELKKIDQAIARTIENVILLVTMGAEPDKGGINAANMAAMQNIFKNQSVGRVLVADYTTKADFIIPDLNKVLGKEKYEVLNKDIEEGLQNVLLGESKYADTQLKLRIFMQRLEEAREVFLVEFLQPEIKRICLNLGIKNIPEAKFKTTDTLDNADLQKLVIRMTELGILTPEQGISTINTGAFPKAEELAPAQEKFLSERELGYWTPLVNSIQIQQQEDQLKQQEFDNQLALKQQKLSEKTAENQVKIAKQAATQKQANNKTASVSGPSGGRPMGTSKAEQYSAKNISQAVKLINEFELRAFRDFALKFGLEQLEGSKQETVEKICEQIISSTEIGEWDDVLASVVEDISNLAEKKISDNVLQIAEKHQLDDLAASILYHSTKIV